MEIFQKIIKFIIDGGPIIMSSILICSIVALIIIIERLIYYKNINKNDNKIIERISSALKNKHFDEALTICDTMPSPITNLMRIGIINRDYSIHEIQESIKDQSSLEIPKLEKNLTTLGTIANIAPLLGLLGTVVGNMEAFGLIGTKSALGSMELLSGGIAKALLTTVFGLSVAIPVSIFYNYLTNKANNLILTLEARINELVLIIKKNKVQ